MTITVDSKKYRISARNKCEVLWKESMPQIEAAIREISTQRNLDDPNFGCQVVGPFHGRDEILIVRAE